MPTAGSHRFYERGEGDPEVRPLTMRAPMNLDVVYSQDHDLVPDAMRVMRGKQARHVPIVDEGGKLAGIVTETDLMKQFKHVVEK